MLLFMSHFFVKAIIFLDLAKAISFSITFTFRISAMRLFKFMKFFSLDLKHKKLKSKKNVIDKYFIVFKKGVIVFGFKNP